MSTISHESGGELPRPRRFSLQLANPEMWASIAICVIWLVVFLDAILGPNFVSNNTSSSTTIPSAIFLALFAWASTRAISKRAFGRDRGPS